MAEPLSKDINLQLEEREVLYPAFGASGSRPSQYVAVLLDATTGDVYLDEERINDVPYQQTGCPTVFQSLCPVSYMRRDTLNHGFSPSFEKRWTKAMSGTSGLRRM